MVATVPEAVSSVLSQGASISTVRIAFLEAIRCICRSFSRFACDDCPFLRSVWQSGSTSRSIRRFFPGRKSPPYRKAAEPHALFPVGRLRVSTCAARPHCARACPTLGCHLRSEQLRGLARPRGQHEPRIPKTRVRLRLCVPCPPSPDAAGRRRLGFHPRDPPYAAFVPVGDHAARAHRARSACFGLRARHPEARRAPARANRAAEQDTHAQSRSGPPGRTGEAPRGSAHG